MAAFDRSADAADPFTALTRLYHEVDALAADVARRHPEDLVCGDGCSECCIDGITVFEIEAEHIRRHHQGLLEVGRPHPRGACPFLDNRGSCRIYEHRPYVCRNQGLPLRWLDDDDPERPVERRDICPRNEVETKPIEKIPAEDCWTIGPFESRLLQLQVEFGGDPLRRVPLRHLFRSGDDSMQRPQPQRTSRRSFGSRATHRPSRGKRAERPGRPPRDAV